MFAGDEHILTKIQSSDMERAIIEGDILNDKNNYSN